MRRLRVAVAAVAASDSKMGGLPVPKVRAAIRWPCLLDGRGERSPGPPLRLCLCAAAPALDGSSVSEARQSKQLAAVGLASPARPSAHCRRRCRLHDCRPLMCSSRPLHAAIPPEDVLQQQERCCTGEQGWAGGAGSGPSCAAPNPLLHAAGCAAHPLIIANQMQVVRMADGHIVAAASTHEAAAKEALKAAGTSTSCKEAARAIGESLAQRAQVGA